MNQAGKSKSNKHAKCSLTFSVAKQNETVKNTYSSTTFPSYKKKLCKSLTFWYMAYVNNTCIQ